MRISTIALLSLCTTCLAQSAIAQSPNILSGTLDPAAADENDGLFVHTSDSFDPDETRKLAVQASEAGDYAAAFSHHLAVCFGSENGADSCYQAAEIARDNEFNDLPPALRERLYGRGCTSGHAEACTQVSGRD